MATITGEVTGVTIIDPKQVEITIRRGSDEQRYRFRHVPGPPVTAVGYDWQFQHDFGDEYEAFRMVLRIAGRALRGDLPQLPLPLPEEPGTARSSH